MSNAKQTKPYAERPKAPADIEAEQHLKSAYRMMEALGEMINQSHDGNAPAWPVQTILEEINFKLSGAVNHYCAPSMAEMAELKAEREANEKASNDALWAKIQNEENEAKPNTIFDREIALVADIMSALYEHRVVDASYAFEDLYFRTPLDDDGNSVFDAQGNLIFNAEAYLTAFANLATEEKRNTLLRLLNVASRLVTDARLNLVGSSTEATTNSQDNIIDYLDMGLPSLRDCLMRKGI